MLNNAAPFQMSQCEYNRAVELRTFALQFKLGPNWPTEALQSELLKFIYAPQFRIVVLPCSLMPLWKAVKFFYRVALVRFV
jgi:hypothetical protein